MKIIKKIIDILKEIFSNLWLTILTLFRVEPVNQEKKVIDISKPQKEEKKTEIYKDTNIPIPDEDPSKSNNEYNYKQSIGTISNDIKEEIKAKVNKREIYFSDMVVLNLIVESLEDNAKFSYKELSDEKKELVNNEVEKIQEKISPSLKKNMSLNKITTKEELKSEIDRKIIPYIDKVKKVITKEVIELHSENDLFHREEIVEDKTVEIPILKEETPKKEEVINKPKVEKKELFKVEKVDKKELNNNVYFMADLLKNKSRELDIEDSVKVSEDTAIIPNLRKEVADSIQNKSKKLPFIMVPNNEDNRVKLKDKIRNATVVAPLAVAATLDIGKEKDDIKDEIIEKKEAIIEEPNKDIVMEESINKDIVFNDEDIAEIPKLKEDIDIEDIHKEMIDELEGKPSIKIGAPRSEKKLSADNIKTIVQEMEEVSKDIDSKKADIDLIKEEKDNKKDIIEDKEENIEDKLIKTANLVVKEINKEEELPKSKIDNRIINNYNEQYTSVEDKFSKEKEKFDFEERNYDYLDNKINDILYSIEMFEIENEDKINSKDKEKLDNTKKKLRILKNDISNQKDVDLEEEVNEIDSKITKKELDSLNKEIEKLHIEHQEELDDMLLFKIKQIEQYSDKEIEEKETILIKSKLKKALIAVEIPSILSLPFVKNRYFFYFTVGLIVNNHFNFLNAIFKRKDVQFDPLDLSLIKNGKDSLDKAIGVTYKNMVYLDYLEKESISKYPKLANDEEFTNYIKRIRNKLNKNYTKLNNKQKILDKYMTKINKKNKVLKKYKLIKEES